MNNANPNPDVLAQEFCKLLRQEWLSVEDASRLDRGELVDIPYQNEIHELMERAWVSLCSNPILNPHVVSRALAIAEAKKYLLGENHQTTAGRFTLVKTVDSGTRLEREPSPIVTPMREAMRLAAQALEQWAKYGQQMRSIGRGADCSFDATGYSTDYLVALIRLSMEKGV